MAISNSIDGSSNSGVNQIFDLLAVMADPKAYNEKLKALQDANEENQKLIQLVGPAEEILTLRDKARQELQAAQESAKLIVEEAKADAKDIRSKANAAAAKTKTAADDLNKAAEAAVADAEKKTKEINAKIAQLDSDGVAIDAARKKLAAEAKAVKEAEMNAKDALSAANAEREAIIAKHKAFIESLA